MTSDPTARTSGAPPLWQQIAERLARRIADGEFEAGARLPSQQELADQYRVNRHTLRQATQALEARGYLSIRRGSGLFARKLVIDYPLSRQTRLTRNLAAAGETARRELVNVTAQAAQRWARPLGLRSDARVEVLQTRSTVRGRPICLALAAYPAARFKGIADRFVVERSISKALAAFGVSDYSRLRSIVSARLPTPEEADWLERPVATPVLVVDSVNVDGDGVPVEAAQTIFASDAIQFVVEPEQNAG